MKEIYDTKGKRLCLVWRKDDWSRGLDFLTKEHQFLQVGTWWYDKGKKLDRHYHNLLERKSDITQECVVVLSGEMLVNVYDEDNEFVENCKLKTGELAIFEGGGHGYEILSDDTRIVESKNGPFMGLEKDKTRF